MDTRSLTIARNGLKDPCSKPSLNVVDPWRPKRLRPEYSKYSCKFLSFISKIREAKPEIWKHPNAPTRYVFQDGLHKPHFCPKLTELEIPDCAKISFSDRRLTSGDFYECQDLLDTLPFVKGSTGWGFDPKRMNTKSYIPWDIKEVNIQQHKMSPVIQYINWHPEVFHAVKPNFVCNRHILKKLMLLSAPNYSFSFLAEKKDGTIYLRELYDATKCIVNGTGNIGSTVTNTLLSTHGLAKKGPFDMNEAVYGAYVGHVGPDIKVLFTAEIDAFLAPEKEKANGKLDLTEMEKKVVEMKTMQQYLWTERNLKCWQTAMASTWAQCFLIGGQDVVCSLLLETDLVSQVISYKVNSMLDQLEGYDGHRDSHKESFFIRRLETALSTLREKIQEDTPAVYIATVQQSPRTKARIVTEVQKITNFSNFPKV